MSLKNSKVEKTEKSVKERIKLTQKSIEDLKKKLQVIQQSIIDHELGLKRLLIEEAATSDIKIFDKLLKDFLDEE